MEAALPKGVHRQSINSDHRFCGAIHPIFKLDKVFLGSLHFKTIHPWEPDNLTPQTLDIQTGHLLWDKQEKVCETQYRSIRIPLLQNR